MIYNQKMDESLMNENINIMCGISGTIWASVGQWNVFDCFRKAIVRKFTDCLNEN